VQRPPQRLISGGVGRETEPKEEPSHRVLVRFGCPLARVLSLRTPEAAVVRQRIVVRGCEFRRRGPPTPTEEAAHRGDAGGRGYVPPCGFSTTLPLCWAFRPPWAP
jgi:hypothetical protein